LIKEINALTFLTFLIFSSYQDVLCNLHELIRRYLDSRGWF